MPFTFSHPAIVLPFLKNQKLSATALIVGSMSPDFEYFFRMKMESELSHTLIGVFLVDFPLGFIVIYAFHELVKHSFISNLPVFFQRRLQLLKETNWLTYFKSNVGVVLFSFFLGAISHFVLDSMTHWDGYVVQRIVVLNKVFWGVPLYEILQYLSSVVGLVCIAVYIAKQPEKDCVIEKIDVKYWLLSLVLMLIIFGVRLFFGTPLEEIGEMLVSVLFPMMLAVTIAGFYFRNKRLIS